MIYLGISSVVNLQILLKLSLIDLEILLLVTIVYISKKQNSWYLRNFEFLFTRLHHYKRNRFMIKEYERRIHRNGDKYEINW